MKFNLKVLLVLLFIVILATNILLSFIFKNIEHNFLYHIVISLMMFGIIFIILNKYIKISAKHQSSNILMDSIINTTNDIIFYKDKDFKYLGCNNAFLEYVDKRSKEDVIGRNDFELFTNEMATHFRQMDVQMLKENTIRTNSEWAIFPSGKEVYYQTQQIPFKYDEENIGILGISRDITEVILAKQYAEAVSYIDELTNIKNRKAYNEKILELLALYDRHETSFSMIIYDIDNFKIINDTYGHITGDKVLVEMSNTVKSMLRKSDYLYRIGGEEFIILFVETSLDDAYKVAQKIKNEVENMNIIENETITISIGLTQVEKNDCEDSIFHRADELMYKSKKNGRNKISI